MINEAIITIKQYFVEYLIYASKIHHVPSSICVWSLQITYAFAHRANWSKYNISL